MANKQFVIGFWSTISIASSSILILLLKIFARRIRCKYTSTLIAYHYLATWCVLELAAFSNNIRRTSNVPIRNRIYLAVLVLLSVFFNSSSLEANSVAFYQLAKLFCIPCILVYNSVLKKIKPHKDEISSLSLVILGVAIFTISDMEYSIKGFLFAFLGIVSTAYSQISIQDFEKQYSLSGSELQLVIAPYQFVIALIAATIFNTVGEGNFMTYEFSLLDIVILLGTCFFAVFSNISCFSVIANSSAVTFQVLGHVKTILIITASAFLFPMNIDTIFQKILAVIGAICALIGALLYYKALRSNINLDVDESKPFIPGGF